MRNFSTTRGFADCCIENLDFIVSERVQVNPDNSWAKSALTFILFKLNTLHKETLPWNNYILGKPDKMLILNLIHFKDDKKLIIVFTKYIQKYMNMAVKWTLNDFKNFKMTFLKDIISIMSYSVSLLQ